MLKKLVFITIMLAVCMDMPVIHADPGVGPNGGKVKVGENIIRNPGFEADVGGLPLPWQVQGNANGAISRATGAQVLSGTKSLEISSTELTDIMAVQQVSVKPDTYYRIMFNVLPKNIHKQFGAPHLLLYYGNSPEASTHKYFSSEMKDTGGYWSNIGFYIKTLKDTNEPLHVALRLGGGMGDKNAGTAFFDDISMQQVENPEVLQKFEVVSFNETGLMEAPTVVKQPSGSNHFGGALISIAALMILIVTGFTFYKRSRSKIEG